MVFYTPTIFKLYIKTFRLIDGVYTLHLEKTHKPGADCIDGWNRVGGVMISVLVSSTVDCGFET
jgi:hypothetical protein